MFSKLCYYFSVVVAFVTLFAALSLLVHIADRPLPPLSAEAQQFKDFEAAYINAYEMFRLGLFEKNVKDEHVTW
jgi:hypothetical protein